MFSRRTHWSFEKNPLLVRLEEIRRLGQRVIDLTGSNPTHGVAYPDTEILKPLAAAQNMVYAPSAMGTLKARQAIARYYQGKSVVVEPERIFLTASTSEAYAFLFRLLTNPGQKVLAPRPSYPLFEYLAQLNDIELNYYSLVYDRRWGVDVGSLKRAMTEDTRAILFVNPNNPTGSFLRRNELEAINELCRRYQAAFICDEVFGDYGFDQDDATVPTVCGNKMALTFSLAGASKTLGLPQMKVAWGTVSGPETLVRESCERLEVILDTYLSVNTPVMNALPHWFSLRSQIQGNIMNQLKENRNFLRQRIRDATGVELLNGEGGWSAILRLPVETDEEELAMTLLEKDSVFIHPGYFFDFETGSHIVISLLPDPTLFKEGIDRVVSRFC